MALLVLLFLDLATMPAPKGDDALYRQAMSDHNLKGAYDLGAGFNECLQIAHNGSDLAELAAPFLNANWRPVEPQRVDVHFSFIGWSGARAWVQLTTSGATSCLLYRRAGPAAFRLVREVRLPH